MERTLLYLGIILLGGCNGQFTSVVTPVGTFIGFQENVIVDGSSIKVFQFLGIPYAEPPVGSLRFAKPVPKSPLNDPLTTQEHGPECIQIMAAGVSGLPHSEDCLFLNIYAPEMEPGQDSLAVMLFIHGGGYIAGSSNMYKSDILAARGDVIVVTINYRLSILGFLNVGNGVGNFGLWDQHLAIKWVHNNIHAFGGDTAKITLFGESAGASSVIYQGMFPGNQGLFHRLIAQSGTASTIWAESQHPKDEALEFASLVGCDDRSSTQLLACLRNINTSVIEATLNDFSNGLYRQPFPFTPSIDNDVLTVSLKDIIRGLGDTRNIGAVLAGFDLMMGVNSGEGIVGVAPELGVEGDPADFLPNRTYFEERLVPLCAEYVLGDSPSQAVTEMMINVYTNWDDPEKAQVIRQSFIDMHGDSQFLAPMIDTIDLYTKMSNKDPYMYYFTALPSNPLVPQVPWINRPVHGEELAYVFGTLDVFKFYNVQGEFQDWEISLSNAVITMWSNFAKTGNPNEPSSSTIVWHPYTESQHQYLEIGPFLNETVTRERLFERRTHFWNTVLPIVNEEMHRLRECDFSTSGQIGVNNYGIRLIFNSLVAVIFTSWRGGC